MPDGFDGSGFSTDSSPEESGTQPGDHRFREGLGEHIRARGELLAIEAREASETLAKRGSLAVAAIAVLGIGYSLILVACVALLGRWIDSLSSNFSGMGWQLSAVAAGLLHVILSLGVFRKLKRYKNLSLFEFTRAEFTKDGEWISKVKETSSRNERSS